MFLGANETVQGDKALARKPDDNLSSVPRSYYGRREPVPQVGI